MVNNTRLRQHWDIQRQCQHMTYLQNRFANGHTHRDGLPVRRDPAGNTTNHNSEAGVFIYSDERPVPTLPRSRTTPPTTTLRPVLADSTTGNGNDATGNTVVNCYNVHCGSGGPRAGSVTAPVHRTPGPFNAGRTRASSRQGTQPMVRRSCRRTIVCALGVACAAALKGAALAGLAIPALADRTPRTIEAPSLPEPRSRPSAVADDAHRETFASSATASGRVARPLRPAQP